MSRPLHIDNAAVSALLMSLILFAPQGLYASGTKISEADIKVVEKAAIDSEEQKKQREAIAAKNNPHINSHYRS